MRPPRCYEALLGFLFLVMGGVFSLLGLVDFFLSIPMRSGDAHVFLVGGLPMLLAGGFLLWKARQMERTWERLRTEGRAVSGELVPEATRHHWYTGWGSDGLHKRHPWTVLCIYRWEGRTYSVRSQFLWQEPAAGRQHPTVWLDPMAPKRAWVDPGSLQYVL